MKLTLHSFPDSQNNMAPHFVVNLLLMLLAAIFHVVGAVKASSQTLIGGIIYIIAGMPSEDI